MIELSPRGPLLHPNDTPPGQWVDDGELGMRVWRGQSDWHTQHGEATVQWLYGRVNYVWNAALPDGKRANVSCMLPASNLFRRAATDGYEYGTTDVRADGVSFTPTEMPVLDVEDDVRGLFDALARDEDLLLDIRNIELARSLYSVLENTGFTHRGVRYQFGQRSAGHFVAALRRSGEVYFDFAWSGNHAPADVAKIEAHFSRLGIVTVVDPR